MLDLLRQIVLHTKIGVKMWQFNRHRGRKGINLTPKAHESKNAILERCCGQREPKGAVPLMTPLELGYCCPICGIRGDNLHFSEYRYCLWCDNCNIDIPSLFCRPIKSRRDAERQYELFESFLKDVRERAELRVKFDYGISD